MTGPAPEALLRVATREQIETYRHLWHRGDVDLEPLAGELRRPHDDVRTDVGRLVDLGLVRLLDDGRRCRAVNPQLALPALTASMQAELQQQVNRLEAAQHGVSELLRDYHDDADRVRRRDVELLDATHVALDRAADLAAASRSELVVSTGQWLAGTDDTCDDWVHLAVERGGRGVDVRVLVHASASGSAGVAALARAPGVRVGTVPVVMQTLVVQDGRAALVGALDDEDEAVLVEGAPLASAFRDLFEYHWRGAEPLDGTGPGAAADLSRMESTLLGLLDQGCTDAMVARRVGMSVRTVRRIVADLAVRAQASSRFQLGSRARSLGWFG